MKLNVNRVASPALPRVEGEYEVVNGVDYCRAFLFPDPDQIQDRHEIKSIAMVGSMGFGKTTKIRALVDLITTWWGRENVNVLWTDNIQLATDAFDDRFVQLIVVDDAIAEQDSRRSMSSENVTATQQYMIVRHAADAIQRGGIIYVFFAYQSPSAVDVRFRETCQLICYSNWYRNRGLEKIMPRTSAAFLRKITERQLVNDYAYRAFAVGVNMAGTTVHLQFPYIPQDSFEVTWLESSGRKHELTEDLIQQVIDTDLINEDNGVIEGWLIEQRIRRRELRVYNFGGGEFREIIKRARARVALAGTGTQLGAAFGTLARWVRQDRGLTYAQMEQQTGISHTVLHRYASRVGGDGSNVVEE